MEHEQQRAAEIHERLLRTPGMFGPVEHLPLLRECLDALSRGAIPSWLLRSASWLRAGDLSPHQEARRQQAVLANVWLAADLLPEGWMAHSQTAELIRLCSKSALVSTGSLETLACTLVRLPLSDEQVAAIQDRRASAWRQYEVFDSER